ncbi:B-type lectin plumieribetin-like isoform X2 [Scomber japonicus]|uniref:B-type lectin plumieribetin-like isoform X2 n=1 Tax=Scomber japonicus TaxID=13676 RepID=UPI002305D8CD|nr:B-type lectin plumieribetin-like isoform X2 [Scomber japonicus]
MSSKADTEWRPGCVPERSTLKDHIVTYQELRKGDFLISQNGKYKAVFQQDGNFVILADGDDSPIWATGTAGKNAFRITVQPDNNLVVYTEQNEPVWASDTWQHFYGYSRAMRLTMTNEGKLVLDKDGTTVWSDGKKW